MDSNFIYERLRALGSGMEQEQYRDISQAFEEVIRYNKKALDVLQKQLQEELRDVSDRYYLYGTVIQEGDAPIVNDFLFPMCEEPQRDGIKTVFCECALSEMEALFQNSHKIIIETGQGTHETLAYFRPCTRYLEEVETLRRVYYDNGLFWRTPYLPYIGRFADMECQELQELEEIRAVRLSDLGFSLKLNQLPLWNVEKLSKKCTVFPIPAIDEQHYRHSLTLPFVQDGYAVRREPSVRNVFYQNDELVLITDDKKQKDFDLYRIAVKRDISVPHYPLTANVRKMRHIDRQAEHAFVRLRTLAEISRIVSSYETGREFVLTEITQEENNGLLLSFRIQKETFLTADQTAFLISEVQEYFPQFKVRGEVQV